MIVCKLISNIILLFIKHMIQRIELLVRLMNPYIYRLSVWSDFKNYK